MQHYTLNSFVILLSPAVCKYIQPVALDDRKDAITCQQYTKYIADRTEGWPIGAFGALMQHVESCAKAVPVGDQRQRLQ